MIYVIARDSNVPMGGVRRQYRLVEVLRSLGRKASVLHSKHGFRCAWFESPAPVCYREDAVFEPEDVLVVPDEIAYYFADFTACPYVIYNQNPYLFLESLNVDGYVRRAQVTLANPLMRGVIVVSESSKELMEYAFPTVRVERIRYGIDMDGFRPSAKTATLAFMPRKSGDALGLVLQLLELRSIVTWDEILTLEGLDERGIQQQLARTAVFLSGSTQEGFGLPVAEALASGALVVGYDGEGGREMFAGPFATRVEGGDVLAFAREVERVVGIARGDQARFAQLAAEGRRFIADNYSVEAEANDIARAWQALLGSS
jgi:glycosyltransferase involved in cell wall biosynthesis